MKAQLKKLIRQYDGLFISMVNKESEIEELEFTMTLRKCNRMKKEIRLKKEFVLKLKSELLEISNQINKLINNG